MAITEFGKAVRKARIDAEVSLLDMATELNTSSAFLSAMEMGRKKVPDSWVEVIEAFFARKGVHVDLGPLADVANKQVSLEGLPPQQQLLMAGFARVNMDDGQLLAFKQLLGGMTVKGKP
jgi:transcriptional regulator with XRE-family HTH domain